MKKVKTFTSAAHPLQSAIVYRDDENGEYRAAFFHNGAHMVNADYHTDDKADAFGTAAAELARAWDMSAAEVKAEITVPDAVAYDVLVTAIEGGINYWAELVEDIARGKDENGNSTYGTVQIADAENEDEAHILTIATIKTGIQRILSAPRKCRADIAQDVLIACLDCDAGQIDADGADAIVQMGLFNEIVYG